MKVNNSTSPVLRAIGDKEKYVTKINEQYNPQLDDVKDRVEKNSEQIVALDNLKNLVQNYTNVINLFRDPATSFVTNTAEIATDDAGVGSNYVAVTLGNGATKGAFDVNVEQVATASKMILDDNGVGFADGVLGLNGVLSIDVNNLGYDTNVNVNDDISQIVTKINSTFKTNNVAAEAFVIKAGANNNYIEVRSKELGNISLGLVGPQLGNINVRSNTPGQSAIINVDGVQIEQANSNLFENVIPGVSIKALVQNTAPNNKQTVNIVSNPESVTDNLAKLYSAYNELKVFTAKMTERSGDTTNGGTGYKDTAVLYNSSEVREAQNMIESFIYTANNTSGGIYRTLSNIGIGLKIDPSVKDAPAGTELLQVVDENKFNDAVNNHIDDIVKLFKSTNSIVADAGNLGSSLTFLDTSSKVMPDNVLNKDIELVVDIDNAGNIINVPFGFVNQADRINNVVGYFATYNNGVITFEGTPFEGLRLNYNTRNIVNSAEGFVLNLTQGIADKTYYKSTNIISEDGLSGSLVVARKDLVNSKTSLATEQQTLENTIKSKIKELDETFDQIEIMSLFDELIMDYIQELINPTE